VRRFRPCFDKTVKIVKVAASPQKTGLADYRYTSDRRPYQERDANFFRFFLDNRLFLSKKFCVVLNFAHFRRFSQLSDAASIVLIVATVLFVSPF